MRPSVLLAGLLALSSVAAAARELEDTVNWARLQGCPRTARTALRETPSLSKAAQRLASGASLNSALASVGYIATRTAALHLSGTRSDADLSRALTGHYCATLTDSGFGDMGSSRRGADIWLIVAAPAAIPSQQNAATIARQILDLTNQARAGGRRCGKIMYAPALPLRLNQALTRAAQVHSDNMARYEEFEHRGHDGSTPADRVERAGYGPHRIVGENIAAGAMTAAEVTQGWLDSPPHCENLMDPRFAEIGIAFGVNRASAETVYWTQDFASPAPDRSGGVRPRR